jgi:hypothetical protein
MTIDAHALAIGVSRYRRVTQLPAVHDAQDVAATLADRDMCAYPAERVTTLLEEAATRSAVLAALDDLAARATPASTVLVYFSGHGGRIAGADEESSCFLIPVDGDDATDEALARTAISDAELSAKLRAIPARRLTVILDCCRASGLAQPRDVRLRAELPASALSLLASGQGRAVLAASGSDGRSYVRPGERNGIFTRHLLDGLRGRSGGSGGMVRICDLFHYVQQQVAAEYPSQRPVFKAELEENYPIALFRGGTTPVLEIPGPPDDFAYDAVVSYRREDVADRAWTEKTLVPALESRGLRLCLAHRDFRLGRPVIHEMERAVQTSRYAVGVFTPAYLAGPFEEFMALIGLYQAIEERAPRFIPVVRRPCRLRLGQRMTEILDLSDDTEVEAGLQRLAQALREPPHRRLGE